MTERTDLGQPFPSRAEAAEQQVKDIVSRICVGASLDPDVIPFTEGSDPIEHLIALVKFTLEADRDLAREERDKTIADLAQTTEAWAIAADDRDEANGLRQKAEADLLSAREELATLKAELASARDSQQRAESGMSHAVMEWNAAGVRAEKAERENSRLQPYVQHPAYCRIWTRRCSVPIIENGVVRGMRSPTKDEIEAVTCTCGLLPLQLEQKKGART